MQSKVTSWLLKYFYYSNVLWGFFIVSCNFSEKKVTKSYSKMIYASLWITYFVINFRRACKFQAIYFTGEAIAETVQLEVTVTYVMVIIIALIQYKNVQTSLDLFTKLFEMKGRENLKIDLFDKNIGRLLAFASIFGDFVVIYLYFFNLFWVYKDGQKDILSPNPLENSALNVCLLVVPIMLVSRISIFIAFCINIILEYLETLNSKIENALEMIKIPNNFQLLKLEISKVDASYDTVLSATRLFEKNYEWIIVVLQCYFLVVGVNQVNQSR